MYIDGDTIIHAAAIITALGVIGGVVVAVVKTILRDKHQSEIIKAIQEEQKVICYGLRGALQGLIEQGCNGPCKEALKMLDKHLNKEAHNREI